MSIFTGFIAAIVAAFTMLSAAGVPAQAVTPAPPAFTTTAPTTAPPAPIASGSLCNAMDESLDFASDMFMYGDYDGSSGAYLGEEDSALVDLIFRLRDEAARGGTVDIMQVLFDHCDLAVIEPGTKEWTAYRSTPLRSQSAKGYYWCLSAATEEG